MPTPPDLSAIDPVELARFRRCRFVRAVFRPRACLQTVELPDGTERTELVPGGWDHEHCDICRARITDGMSYWPNADAAAGHVDLCEVCYPRVTMLI